MASLPENSHIKQVWDILEEADAGDKERLQNYLRNNNISINLKTRNGQTALYLAAEKGLLTELTTLIEAGADVNISTSHDHVNTPIMVALVNGQFECLQALIKSGAQVNDLNKYGKSVLMLALGQLNCFEALIEAGACVNQRTSSGVPLLALVSSTEEFQALIKAGANVNSTDDSGRTALMIVSEAGKSITVRALLQVKADPNIQDRDGKTALMYAIRHGEAHLHYSNHSDCIKALISYGANMDLEDNSQNTALILALKEYHYYRDWFELLLNSGANPVINGLQRSWLNKLFVLEKGQYACTGSPRKAIWTNIHGCCKRTLRFLVCNGIVIDYSKIYIGRSRNKSAVVDAVLNNHLDVFKYVMANCFLTYDDLKDMRKSLYKIRRWWLIKHGFERRKLNEEHSNHPPNEGENLLEEIPDETHTFVQQALNEPWPLVKLAFIAVSSALGLSPGREERIPKTGLPDRLQRMLLFQEPVSRLPVSEWEDIPLTFDPVEYEKLPKPRPLLYYWPVGRDLVI